MRLVFSHKAETDIEAIGDFIARHDPVQAARFVAALRAYCRTLRAFPEAHPRREEFGAGVRLGLHGRYLVFYVPHRGVLEIRRVIHGARDLGAGLE